MNTTRVEYKRKRVLLLAAFFSAPDDIWIDDFCNRPDLEFRKVVYPHRRVSWHQEGAVTPVEQWHRHFKYSYGAMKCSADCIVTCFPQLALTTAALLRFSANSQTRLVAWNFNLGFLSTGWKQLFARTLLRRVDHFVVHSRGEIDSYASWLGVDKQKFTFVPLQRGAIPDLKPSPIPRPYIVSMGSANRDFRTLVDAVIGTGIRTVVISKKTEADRLPDHPDLLKLSDRTWEECDSILSGAQLNVVPIARPEIASGQVNLTTSLRMGIPTIVSRSIGTVDYIRDGETGLLVPPGDPAALRSAIKSLWHDEELSRQIGVAGRKYADEFLSDEAAARHLADVLDKVLESRPHAREQRVSGQ